MRVPHRVALTSFTIIIGAAVILGYLSGFFAQTVPLYEPRLEIVTDKAEYVLGETINATFYIVNNRTQSVSITPFNEYELSGNSVGDPNKTFAHVSVDYAAGVNTIVIPAGSKYRFERSIFKPTLKGEFIIQVSIHGRNDGLSGNLTVMIR
jgi:hypothetical protein